MDLMYTSEKSQVGGREMKLRSNKTGMGEPEQVR